MITRKKMLKMASLALAAAVLPVGFVRSVFAGKISFGAAKGARRSGQVRLRVPSIAESGANVPVTVSGSMPASQVESVHIFVDKNPTKWAISMDVTDKTGKAYISTRIKMGKSSRVRGVIKLKNGTLLQSVKNVKVTVGGCG